MNWLQHLPPIQGNAGRLQQVFLNLFLNAKDAMPGGGTLRIATYERRWRERGGFRHRQWNRAGTHSAHLRPVLYHQDCAAEGQRRGTGLGLVGDLRNHSGARGQDSRGEPPEEGTTFYLEFPLMRKAVNV